MDDEALAEAQSLRLLRAFHSIADQETRSLIIELVETAKRGGDTVSILETLKSRDRHRRH